MSAAVKSESPWGRAARALHKMSAQAGSAVAAVLRSARPLAGDAWLADAQLRLYRRSTRHNAVMLALSAFFICWACAGGTSWQARTLWWCAVFLAAVAMDGIYGRLDRGRDNSIEAIRTRAGACVAATAVFALAWASMSVFLWAPGDEIDHLVIVLVLACSIAGWIAIGGVHPASALVAWAICGAFLVVRLMTATSPLDHTLAALSAIYLGLMAFQLAAVASTSTRLLVLEHERAGLVDSLRHAKAESDRDRARATEAGRTKSEFLSNMSHELRTPMNAILGFSEVIKDKSFGNAVDTYAEYAEIIHSSGRHLLCLIDDMLDLARIEGGRPTLREASVDIGYLVSDAIESSETAATRASLSLARRVARGFPPLRADERAVRQIIGHLVSNAIKFTPAGGCVTIFAHIEGDGRPAFGVEDTGIGIEEEDQVTVFERFGKGRHDVAAADKGSGLGLAVVKGFAEAHDGEAVLESAPGCGTRVTVYLPASRIEPCERTRTLAG